MGSITVKAHLPEDVLEVGNVLSHYFDVNHLIIDKYEHRPGVIADDIVNVDLPRKFDCIVSISTLEHVGWDEPPRVPGKHLHAIEKIRQLLSPDGEFLATIPLGYNPLFDRDLFVGKLGCNRVFYFKRLSTETWRQSTLVQIQDSRYGDEYRTTNGLALCVWNKI